MVGLIDVQAEYLYRRYTEISVSFVSNRPAPCDVLMPHLIAFQIDHERHGHWTRDHVVYNEDPAEHKNSYGIKSLKVG